jgi:hypothetical protein
MKTHFKSLVLIALALLATGCAISTYYLQDGAKTYPPTDPNAVKIYAAETLNEKYDVIGSIAVHGGGGDGDDAAKLLRERAAKLGATAVIKARLTKVSSYENGTGLSGVAVRTF